MKQKSQNLSRAASSAKGLEDMSIGSSIVEKSKHFEKLLSDHTATPEFKSSHLLEYFISALSNRWILCRQLAAVFSLWRIGVLRRSNTGTYRVELIVAIFHRIFDLCNFHLVLAELSAEEHAAIIARVGWLNIFNPLKPDGAYRLDLAVWEERQVVFVSIIGLKFCLSIVKSLMHLSLTEPGQCCKQALS
jgi:hypothetical protein